MTTLFDSVQLGEIALRNRIVMAPMTRSRAGGGDVPTELHVEYYRQRANAGLIISEGVFPSAIGKGYVRTPGIATDAQVAPFEAKRTVDPGGRYLPFALRTAANREARSSRVIARVHVHAAS